MNISPIREILKLGIFPFGLDVAPCLFGLVAGGSLSQNSLRTLDTIFSCNWIISSSYLACKSLILPLML